jgi:hypothetical protein
MSKQSPLSLLLGPFVQKNQQLYKADKEMLKSFEGLTLEDLQITNIQHQADGVRTANIDSQGRNFTGPDQTWKSANVNSPKVLTLTDSETLADTDAAQAKQEPGVYLVGEGADAKAVVVIAEGTAEAQQADAATAVLIDALKYDIPADQITATDGTIIVEGDTIYGEVDYVVAKAPVAELQPGEPMDLNG